MQKIYKKYQGVAIEDDLAYVSKEFKQFASYFKRRLKMNLEDRGINLVEFHVGHYDLGGFAEKDGKYVYFSYSFCIENTNDIPAVFLKLQRIQKMFVSAAKWWVHLFH